MAEVEEKPKKVKPDKEKKEHEARKQILEELFYDFNKSELQVYRVNFFRGIFLGFGTVLGGTLLVAIIIWVLGQFANLFPMVSDYINAVTHTLQK